LTTTRMTDPHGPSLQLASAPITNGVASAIAPLLWLEAWLSTRAQTGS
jgi:hypothetical protein